MEALRVHLLKFYNNVEVHTNKWNETLRQAEATIRTLSGLSDQLDCILKTRSCTLTEKFPHLKGRLELIVRSQMEPEITILRVYLEDLLQLNQKLKTGWDIIQTYYLENYVTLHSDSSFFQGNPLYPPTCFMIEWSDDINMFYVQKYLNLKFVLDSWNSTPEAVVCLSRHWSPKCVQPTIVDSVMAKMQVFVNEK